MNRLTKEQIEQIKVLRKDKTSYELAKQFNVSQPTILYWTSERTNNKVKERIKVWFKNLSREKRKKIYDSKKEYLRNYMRNRYQLDPIYREKQKERVRNGRK
jgi:Zn-dependent peptidase ImmA (M78 family)